MKKYLALTMAACMALSLAACGSSASSTTSSSAAASTEATSDSAATAEATGSDNITGIAQCCDVGTLDDESFNQGCWEAVKATAMRTASSTTTTCLPARTPAMKTARP